MSVDMKETIARAVKVLVVDKKVKKLTVKDIVEECNITRQTFYYHFEDIPDLLRWSLNKKSEEIFQEYFEDGSQENALRYFILVALNMKTYIQKGMSTNYKDEIDRILIEHFYKLSDRIVIAKSLYKECNIVELSLVKKYQCHGFIGMISQWSDEDTKNMDQIINAMYKIMIGEIRPF